MLKFVAVVLTYNRPQLLEENIVAVLNQEYLPEELIVIDNSSTDNTEELVRRYMLNEKLKIRYVKLARNFGSAGGFYYAIKYAYDLGYEYILTMDDDGKPCNNSTFKMLLKALESEYKKNEAFIIGPLVTYDGDHVTFGPDFSEEYLKTVAKKKEPVLKHYISPYNGTIISRACISKIGLPNKDFYLYGDEIDYTFRAEKQKIAMFTVVNALYQHPKANETINKFFGRNIISYENCNKRKQYYYVRNHLYAFVSHKKYLLAFRLFVNRLISVLLFEHGKVERFHILMQALSDCLCRRIYEKEF